MADVAGDEHCYRACWTATLCRRANGEPKWRGHQADLPGVAKGQRPALLSPRECLGI
jgi:hypothetical protein